VAIPDRQPSGVDSTLTIALGGGSTATGTVTDVQVEVKVDHGFLGDLSLTLVAPNGVMALIQGRTLGRQTQLRYTYTLQTTPVLMRLLGQPAQGTWRLRAVDSVPGATGTLLGWSLTLGVS
jgi:subtilisin-like proprotein convertase family protein